MTQVEPHDENEDADEPEDNRFAQSKRLLSFKAAMLSYVVLAALGTVTLTGKFRIFILIVLAGLALKTYVHHLKDHLE